MASSLGQRLRARRIERGLSQADLAGELVSPSYVSLIEAGRRTPERDVLDGLARKLGCSAMFLETGLAPEEIQEQQLQLKFAEIAMANGDLPAAEQQFSTLYRRAADDVRQRAAWGLARVCEEQGNLHDALTRLDALLDAVRRGAPGTPGLLEVQNARMRIYRLAGDFTRSIEVGTEAVREVRDLGLDGTEDEIKLASSLVTSYWARGDLFAAQHLAAEVIARAQAFGSRRAQGQAYWSACLVAADRGQLTLALDLASRTLALLSETGPDTSLAEMRTNYAWLLLKLDPPQLDEADALLARAHEVLTEASFGPDLATCETEMARSALLRGNLDEATLIASRAIDRCADSGAGNDLQLARVVSGLALILGGQIDEGVLTVSAAAEILESTGSRADAAQAWRDLAEALLSLGQSDQAIDALRRAADCAGARSSSFRAGQPVQASS